MRGSSSSSASMLSLAKIPPVNTFGITMSESAPSGAAVRGLPRKPFLPTTLGAAHVQKSDRIGAEAKDDACCASGRKARINLSRADMFVSGLYQKFMSQKREGNSVPDAVASYSLVHTANFGFLAVDLFLV